MTFFEKIRNWSSSIAFAEVGEFDTACEFAGMPIPSREFGSKFIKTFEQTFAAAAFAEEGLRKEAMEIGALESTGEMTESKPSFLDVVGLRHAPVHMYVSTI